MGRNRIIGDGIIQPSKSFKFKTISPKTKGLFGKANSTLKPSEQNYLFVAKQIELLVAKKPYQNITLKQLSHFFLIQYEFRFQCSCIDYNWFNFQKTITKLNHYLNYNDLVKTALFIYNSFEQCIDGTFTREKIITLSTYKRSWYVDELTGEKQKFLGFY